MSPYVIAANALETIINTEFAADGVVAVHDQLHEALGTSAVWVGIAPTAETPDVSDLNVQETRIEIRWLGLWDKEITPTQQVDPRDIAATAERLRVAIKGTSVTASGEVWFFNVEDVRYPNDPTGNRTRFYMRVCAYGNNSALVETTA